MRLTQTAKPEFRPRENSDYATGGVLVERTNKAEFRRLPDGSLVKRYFTSNARTRVERDQISLQAIQKDFGQAKLADWTYRIVDLLWWDVDKSSVCLEFAPGTTLADTPPDTVRCWEYHCGAWLALYHEKMLDSKGWGQVYSDYTVDNVMIDFERRSVIAIDPGMDWSMRGHAYEDVTRHLNSTMVKLLARKQSPMGPLQSFLKGYAGVAKHPPRALASIRAMVREFRREWRDYRKKSIRKSVMFALAMPLLLPLHLVLLLAFLRWTK